MYFNKLVFYKQIFKIKVYYENIDRCNNSFEETTFYSEISE